MASKRTVPKAIEPVRPGRRQRAGCVRSFASLEAFGCLHFSIQSLESGGTRKLPTDYGFVDTRFN